MPGTVLDLFDSPYFAPRAMTDAINIVPNMYGRVGELGLFPLRPVPTTYVEVEYRQGVLNLLPTRERGAPGTQGISGKRNIRVFKIPHIPHGDAILSADIQNRVRFGQPNALQSASDLVNEKLEDMTNKHFITLEHLRMGALKGVILDADGSTIIDLFSEFGISQKTVDFALDVEATDVGLKNMEVLRYVEDNLFGEMMTSVHALCSPEFFDSYTTHASVKEAYDRYSSVQEPLRNDVRRRFVHKNISFEEYRGSASYLNPDGSTTTRRFIAAGEAHFFPLGTRSAFSTYVAPPDTLDEANSAYGQLIYASQERMKHGKGIEFHTESNPLPLCKRPALLVKGTI